LLEQRYIRQVLQEEGASLKKQQTTTMRRAGFSSRELFASRKIDVTDNVLAFEHLAKHRFTDMKRRRTVRGVIKKKNYPIHNRIIYAHANNVVRRVSFGFTDDIKKQMQNIE
jgi:hypothetical protein